VQQIKYKNVYFIFLRTGLRWPNRCEIRNDPDDLVWKSTDYELDGEISKETEIGKQKELSLERQRIEEIVMER